MTLPAALAHIEHFASGGASFVYPFQIDTPGELEVRVDNVVTTETIQYTVTGVGTPTGGTVLFLVPPSPGSIISIRRVVDIEQLLDLIPNAALPAVALEDQLDEIVKQIQMLEEVDSRTPSLPVGTSSALRYLDFPPPGNGMTVGWNSTGTALTLYPSTLSQVIVDPITGRAHGRTDVTVNASAGVAFLSIPGLYPAGVIVDGVTMRIRVTFGNANGLSTLSLGDSTDIARWGSSIPRTAPTVTNPGMWTSYAPFPVLGSTDGILLADVGLFDAVGQATVTSHWTTYAS